LRKEKTKQIMTFGQAFLIAYIEYATSLKNQTEEGIFSVI